MIRTTGSYLDAFDEKAKKEKTLEDLKRSRKLLIYKLIDYRKELKELRSRNEYLEGIMAELMSEADEELEG